MKRVQNWRDFLDDDEAPIWKEKNIKKQKSEKSEEEFNKRTEKKRSKGK